MAELSVEINGKMDKLDKALSDSEKALKQFDKKANKISKTNSNLGSSSVLAAKGMGKLRGQAINGNAAMTAFSRTIQDAPFGIMGVSNNITNLTEQFGYLKNKTGSAGGALKAMLRDLKGFGGVTLAISLATSALVLFGDKLFQTKDKTKELRDEQERLTKSLDDYIFGLSAVEKANVKGEQNAQKELTTLKLLKSQIENTTLSTEKRLEAVREIRRIYPSYFKDMSNEKILNGGLATTYDTLTTSILNRAKATAATNMIVKNSEKLIAIEGKLAVKREERLKAEKKYNAVLDNNKKSVNNYRGAAVDSAFAESGALNVLNKLREEENKLIAKKQTLELANIDLNQTIGDVGGITIPVTTTGEEIREKVKNAFVDFKETYKDEKDYFEDWVEEDPITIADNAEWKSIDWEAYFNSKQFEEKELELKARLEKLKEDINSLPEQTLASGITSIGQSIGQALANGTSVIGAVGMSLLKTLGSFLSQLGAKLILYGVLAKKKGALDVAMLAGGPAAIIAGAAAIKIGVLAVAAGAAISAFVGNATGSGAGAGSQDSGSVSTDTSTFSPSSSSFSGGGSSGGLQNVVFEIQGTKLVGVLSNTLSRNRALGGSLSLT